MSNYAQILTIEARNSHEGMAVIETRPFHSEFESAEASMPFAGSARELAFAEEVIVITGTIKISP